MVASARHMGHASHARDVAHLVRAKARARARVGVVFGVRVRVRVRDRLRVRATARVRIQSDAAHPAQRQRCAQGKMRYERFWLGSALGSGWGRGLRLGVGASGLGLGFGLGFERWGAGAHLRQADNTGVVVFELFLD